ncbi:MAG: BamA/TamA family outer membrane protein [Lewinellaceae bacterium]|nr:BamA/TamA family outer membrane protein [Lewinellaceae bacterium]
MLQARAEACRPCSARPILQVLLFLLFAFPAAAQTGISDDVYLIIDSISIDGNRKTRDALILRELEFASGDSIHSAELAAVLDRNSLRLMNLGIFNTARINVRRWDIATHHITLHIHLIETWYIYPVPLFELADRNFNVWWKEFNHSLRRVNYGIDWNQLNLTGNADVLKAKTQFGYSNKYELRYSRPNVNRKQTIGFDFGITYSRAHEVAYATSGNKLKFHVNPDIWQVIQLSTGGSVLWRPGLFTTHRFTVEYRNTTVADSIARDFNSNFFLGGKRKQRHLSLLYNVAFDHRDIRPYPLSGWLFVAELRQNGLLPGDNLHLFRAYVEYARYFPLFEKRLSFETVFRGRTSLPRSRPPYYNNQALGYGGSFVRGYEYYVADGLDFGLLKTACHVQLFSRKFNLGKFMPLEAFRNLPLKLYLSLNNDLGYANDPYYTEENPLSNHLLWGYGFGLDIVAYYDKTARFEWSWNDKGENGFFIRINTGF